jgi:hypothetical protein
MGVFFVEGRGVTSARSRCRAAAAAAGQSIFFWGVSGGCAPPFRSGNARSRVCGSKLDPARARVGPKAPGAEGGGRRGKEEGRSVALGKKRESPYFLRPPRMQHIHIPPAPRARGKRLFISPSSPARPAGRTGAREEAQGGGHGGREGHRRRRRGRRRGGRDHRAHEERLHFVGSCFWGWVCRSLSVAAAAAAAAAAVLSAEGLWRRALQGRRRRKGVFFGWGWVLLLWGRPSAFNRGFALGRRGACES